MPTLLQLQAEPWWDREVITPELHWLGDELCRRTGAPAYSIGTKGNEVHLNGGHRSQEWILNSDWCTNTHYTVQSGLTAEQLRHIAALDRTPGSWGTAANRARMVVETGRLVTAARAGRLVGVTQIQGTLDGKATYGQNFPSLNTTVPDDSHLDHWHLTFDRRYLHDAALMGRIVDVVLGEEDDMLTPEDIPTLQVSPWQYRNADGVKEWAASHPGQWYPDMHAVLWDTYRKVQALEGKLAAGGLSAAEVAAELAKLIPAPPTAEQVADLLAARLKD